MKDIRDSGGMTVNLDFGMYCKYEIIAITVNKFIIGNSKCNNLLCVRKGRHSFNINGLYCDCDINPFDRDSKCIVKELINAYTTKKNIVGKVRMMIQSCFSNLGSGDFHTQIMVVLLIKTLHAVLFGLCEYIVGGM